MRKMKMTRNLMMRGNQMMKVIMSNTREKEAKNPIML